MFQTATNQERAKNERLATSTASSGKQETFGKCPVRFTHKQITQLSLLCFIFVEMSIARVCCQGRAEELGVRGRLVAAAGRRRDAEEARLLRQVWQNR